MTGQSVRPRRSVVPWSSRLGVGRGANDPTPEKFTVTKLTETKPDGTEDHGGGQDARRILAPLKKDCD
jgi:hypothetical protein